MDISQEELDKSLLKLKKDVKVLAPKLKLLAEVEGVKNKTRPIMFKFQQFYKCTIPVCRCGSQMEQVKKKLSGFLFVCKNLNHVSDLAQRLEYEERERSEELEQEKKAMSELGVLGRFFKSIKDLF